MRVRECLEDLAARQRDDASLRKPAAAMPRSIDNWLRAELEKVKRFVIPQPTAGRKNARVSPDDRAADLAARIRAGEA